MIEGKICLVTGATSGIGLFTALELALKGADVIIVGRDEQRCRAASLRIRQQADNPAVDYIVADLSSQAQIRRLVDVFQERCSRLDVLMNNAGAFFLRRQLSVDGIEMTFALNHLNYFLLTHLLLDVLKASAPARIVNVASNAHRRVGMNFDDLQGKLKYSGFQAYNQSKLANLLFTYELARKLEGFPVTVNALHPGFVATNIGKNNGLLAKLVMPIATLRAIRPEEGARTPVYLASSPDMEGVSGQYFVKETRVSSSPDSYDAQSARRLWEISTEMTGSH